MNDIPPDLESVILDEIAGSIHRLTLPDIEKKVAARFGIDRRHIRQTVRRLIERKTLQYTYTFGTSFLEASVTQPFLVPPRVWIAPSGTTPDMEKDQIAVFLQSGAAFGVGDHPSTRLALRGLQWVAESFSSKSGKFTETVLDVGTGSGVLLIAALKLGFREGRGTDTDPCARSEAQQNLGLNGLEDCAHILDGAPGNMGGPVGLVLANLRLPTIMALLPEMDRRLLPGGRILFSGIHPPEEASLTDTCVKRGWRNQWRDEELGWSALVFKKRGASPDAV